MKKILTLAIASLLTTNAFAATYEIDPTHTSVGFKIKHLAISNVTGNFTEFTGAFNYDPAKPEASSVDAKIAVKSINTQNQKRDDHLRSPEFFDAAKFGDMTFKSKSIKDATKDGFKLVGDLTIRGVSKEVTLDVANGGEAKDPWGNQRIAFAATAKINRKDFGLTWNKALETGGLLVGEDVTINLDVEAIKKG